MALARIAGIHRRQQAPHWFSHESAAMLWGLPLWKVPSTTHLLREHRASANADPLVTHHVGQLLPLDCTVLNGIPVTSLERTLVDCAGTLPPLQGLVVADAALRVGADRAAINDLIAGRTGRRGSSRARAIVALADDGAESPGETATRFAVLRAGFVVPRTQIPVETRIGTFWADLGWEEWKLVLEYDGRTKYRERDTERFMLEKRRHDAVVETGHRVLRVTREDLAGEALTQRILRLAPPQTAASLRPRRELMTPRPARS